MNRNVLVLAVVAILTVFVNYSCADEETTKNPFDKMFESIKTSSNNLLEKVQNINVEDVKKGLSGFGEVFTNLTKNVNFTEVGEKAKGLVIQITQTVQNATIPAAN